MDDEDGFGTADMEDREDDDVEIDDEWEKKEEDEDWDKDFEEFDLPPSKAKKVGGKKSKADEDDDLKLDDFKDFDNFDDDDYGGGKGGFDDDDY